MPNSEQKGFIVYGDTKAVVDELTNEQAGELFRGMLEYFEDGTDPKFNGVLKIAFIPIKQQMDRDQDKYVKRCERNRANAAMRWHNSDANGCNRMQSDANDANTDKDTGTGIKEGTGSDIKSPESDTNLPLSLISYLNSKTGSKYQADANVTRMIIGLLGQGYSETDMRTVIDRKCAEWSDDAKMKTYLRPSTLFGDKFGEYLNAPESIEAEQKKGAAAKQEQLLKSLSDKESELEQLSEQIDEIRNGGDDSISEHFDELNDLKLKQAIAEQDIESLKRRTGAVGT